MGGNHQRGNSVKTSQEDAVNVKGIAYLSHSLPLVGDVEV